MTPEFADLIEGLYVERFTPPPDTPGAAENRRRVLELEVSVWEESGGNERHGRTDKRHPLRAVS